MPNYYYRYGDLNRTPFGSPYGRLVFFVTEAAGTDGQGNVFNSPDAPVLQEGAYVHLQSWTGYSGIESFHTKHFPFANFQIKKIEQRQGGDNGTFLAIYVDYPACNPAVDYNVETIGSNGQMLFAENGDRNNAVWAAFDPAAQNLFNTLGAAYGDEFGNSVGHDISGTGTLLVTAAPLNFNPEDAANDPTQPSLPDGYTYTAPIVPEFAQNQVAESTGKYIAYAFGFIIFCAILYALWNFDKPKK